MRLNQLHLLYLEASFCSNICPRAESGSLAAVAVGAGPGRVLRGLGAPGAPPGEPMSGKGGSGGGRGGQMLQEKRELIYNPGRELMGHYSVITRSLPILLV